ncbi:HNH endonuclease [Bifidobacterium samirii]|uniref:HNH endonuclease n=1 Tax=Bifidobacterium samirii TaxID=2306974 RepID=A0A430FFA3_9BIFI|nr:HNH endonuclease domain-containing protein [Bifidobacterium samirii]RSX51422.1 HNH endonuclease [Bifidobacterium samirii]
MKNVEKNLYDDCGVLHHIINSTKNKQRKETLSRIESNILLAYNQYPTDFTALNGIKRSCCNNDDERQSLIKLYNSRAKIIKKMKKEILNKVALCPYCYYANTVDTIDHFFPKSIFPEYSIYSFNLIPCCSKCNRIKSDTLPSSGKRYIHFYVDPIPDKKWFYVKLAWNAAYDRADLDITLDSTVLGTDMKKLIMGHFDNLKLLSKYEKEMVHLISDSMESLNGERDVDRCCWHFSIRYNDEKKNYGENYYLTALFHELSTNHEFVKNMIQSVYD